MCLYTALKATRETMSGECSNTFEHRECTLRSMATLCFLGANDRTDLGGVTLLETGGSNNNNGTNRRPRFSYSTNPHKRVKPANGSERRDKSVDASTMHWLSFHLLPQRNRNMRGCVTRIDEREESTRMGKTSSKWHFRWNGTLKRLSCLLLASLHQLLASLLLFTLHRGEWHHL